MVLAQNFADESPLTPLRLRRAAAETELKKSLVTSSMLALTFCVLVLLARVLFAPADLRVVDIPTWNPDTRIFEPPPVPRADFVPSRPVADQGPGEVLPVDHVVKDETDRIAPDAPVPPGPIVDGPPGGTAPLQGRPGVGTAPPPEPGANDFVYTEQLPMPVTRVKPDYPQIARDAGMEGKVVVRMLVDIDGHVRRAEIETSSAMFDADALAAARRWTFTPALTDGKPVMVWVRVPFDFRLH